MDSCRRCGRTKRLHIHHIQFKCDGGGEEPENKEILCQSCHAYIHARDNLIREIDKWTERLKVLDILNTPAKIRERGKYQTYYGTLLAELEGENG